MEELIKYLTKIRHLISIESDFSKLRELKNLEHETLSILSSEGRELQMKKYNDEFYKLRSELFDVRLALVNNPNNKALKEYEKELLQLMKENLLHQEERRTEIYKSYKGRK